MKRLVVVFVCLFCVAGAYSEATSFSPQSSSDSDIARSENDQSVYRHLTLPNTLQVLLVSDPDADKAAAALDVFVGSSHDPVRRQGLAHFLEHMLFLGTDKYPEPDEYQAFIGQHGGQHNAYTSFEHTNYFFDIDPAHFEPALDRFSRFFVAPLFNADYVEREKNAVHSEYKARIKDDYRRQMDVYSQVVNPAHPAAKFSVGNLDTLADEKGQLREDLLSFYKAHYSANRMALVVLAPQPLDQLEAMVRDRFANVPNHASQQPKHGKPLLEPGEPPKLVSVQPVREMRELSITFPLPAVDQYQREQPLGYLGNLIGHEGKGSLLWLLKNRGWAENLRAGQGISDTSGSSFSVTVGLTPEGYANWQQVLSLVFRQIDLVADEGISQWRFDEQGALANMQFRYMEQDDPVHRVSRLANRLHQYPYTEVLRGPYRMDLYDAGLIADMASRMTADNAMVLLAAPEVETNAATTLYQVPYKVEPLPKIQPVAATTDLSLPGKNPFIPERFSLKHPNKASEPGLAELLVKQPDYRLWHYADHFYRVPKAQLYVAVKTPAVEGVRHAAMMDLYLRAVEYSLNETSYEAALAGLRYGINRRPDGLGFMISGFDDKLSVLSAAVVEALLTTELTDERLELLRQELIRKWRNSTQDTPYIQLMREVGLLLNTTAWQPARLADELEKLDFSTFRQYVKTIFNGASLELLASGNLQVEEVKVLAQSLSEQLASGNPADWLPRGIARVAPGEKINAPMSIPHKDAGILRYYQGRDDSVAEAARFMFLRQLIKSPFFHELRTEQQLGYVVAAVDQGLERVPGFGLLVQSPSAPLSRLEQAIDQFLDSYAEQLAAMPAEEFERHRASILTGLTEKPKSLAEQSGRFWTSIDLRDYQFDMRQQLIVEVQNLTHAQMLEVYRNVVVAAGFSMQVDTSAGDFMSGSGLAKERDVYRLPEKM
ncbi:insulinase family protein [uncultured Porticoccus sp.]|jgi:secreted Zn-dependent insulinase-like peptidase|uniref:insulinase family protein n=1 Tax=Porticoccus sp. TaxID=2024853 RepID=UPI0030D97706|tara:strand:+ start:499 stop:3327 length:2829 start_codon:yes stop_codon:yes gene_type:complete